MTEQEWEDLCDGCGLCCRLPEPLPDGQFVACPGLDTTCNQCKFYTTRLSEPSVACLKVTPSNVKELYTMGVLPPTCGYVRHVYKGWPKLENPPEAKLVAFELAPRGYRRRYQKALRKWNDQRMRLPR